MTIEELAELFGNFSAFTEAFTSVTKEVEKGVLDNNEDLTVYHVTFNEHEFMSFGELDKIYAFLRRYLQLNGIDTTAIKSGRPNDKPIDWRDTSLEEI